jgi:hypothetical protein
MSLTDICAYHRGDSFLAGHRHAFRESTIANGESASTYFQNSGISDLALANNGTCAFKFGWRPALYQITNAPLVQDDVLAPSTTANRELFGDFMGALPNSHPGRAAKRLAVERSLGSIKFVNALEPFIRLYAAEFFHSAAGRAWETDEFALHAVAYIDSRLPGVLDLWNRPLTDYLDGEYAVVIRRFFEIASEVISKNNRSAMAEFNLIVPFIRQLLLDNLPGILAAGESNLIRSYFRLWRQPLSAAGIRALPSDLLKELGTIVVATFDTTALSLLWALCYLETAPDRDMLTDRVSKGTGCGGLTFAELTVLEAVRLGGSNPAALWRRTVAPFTLRHNRGEALIRPGTMLWLDRRQANQDRDVFPHPSRFTPENIRSIVRSERETISSVLSRNRYEINSFSMINTMRNPRKCPGRLFSVSLQAILLSELYSGFDVSLRGADVEPKKHASMPRPAMAGSLTITSKQPARKTR